MRFAVILRRYSSMSVLFAPSKVTAELLPSAFGVHKKNVSSPLRSGEITTAAIPVFGKAETPPALWRRGVQPGGKNGSVFSPCPPSGRFTEAARLLLHVCARRVAEGVDPYHAPTARFILQPPPLGEGDRASGGRSSPDTSCELQR